MNAQKTPKHPGSQHIEGEMIREEYFIILTELTSLLAHLEEVDKLDEARVS